mmetsp:Transcript_2143/g.4582  ORF Transcript_2143/g.4582 Transcript_2143/m.4582 type:complete len:82 (+) Transcript_2143:218-463(+)
MMRKSSEMKKFVQTGKAIEILSLTIQTLPPSTMVVRVLSSEMGLAMTAQCLPRLLAVVRMALGHARRKVNAFARHLLQRET